MFRLFLLGFLFSANTLAQVVSPNNPLFLDFTADYDLGADSYADLAIAPAFGSDDLLDSGETITAQVRNSTNIVLDTVSFTNDGTSSILGCNCLNLNLNSTAMSQKLTISFTTSSGSFDLDNVLVEVKSAGGNTVMSGQPYVPPSTGYSIVYARFPATTEPRTITINDGDPDEYNYDFWHGDLWDALPETARQTYTLPAYGQLVLRAEDGSEEIIHDCTGTPVAGEDACMPMDPAVSMDGTKIVYAEYWGEVREVTQAGNAIDVFELRRRQNREHARIWVYDTLTKVSTPWPECPNAPCHDIAPIFLPNGKVMFVSNRDKKERVNIVVNSNPNQYAMRPYIADADGSNAKPVGPHVVSGALHPIVMNDGWVAMGEMWDMHKLAYHRSNGQNSGHDTRDNQWIMIRVTPEYGDAQALLGAHHTDYYDSQGRSSKTKALHFFGQLANNDLCTVNYYRTHNDGLGDVICWPVQDNGLEGPYPGFMPEGFYQVAPWANFGDFPSYLDQEGLYTGKLGFPEGLPDGSVMMTFGRGYCNRKSINNFPAQLDTLKDPFQYGCRKGIYKTTIIPSAHPDDLQVVVDTYEWEEFNARVVRPRNIPVIEMNKTGDSTCELVSTNAGVTDGHSPRAYEFSGQALAMANDGTEIYAIRDRHAEVVTKVRLMAVADSLPYTSTPNNMIGHPVTMLDDIDLLPDKSFKARVPCDMPFIMLGINDDGRVVKRDQIPMSLREGERRICKGCHLHATDGRPYEQSDAFAAVPQVLANTPEPMLSWTQEIGPMLKTNCGTSGCHTGFLENNRETYDRLIWDFKQELVEPYYQKFDINAHNEGEAPDYHLYTPQHSKYVSAMFALESLLYWKAAGARTDYRTDFSHNDDIDFGPAHAKHLTDQELDMLGTWIESGAPYEPLGDFPEGPPPGEDTFSMINPVPIGGPCLTWEEALNRENADNCMFQFTMHLEVGEYEPYAPSDWPINIVVPPATGTPQGINLAYHGGSGTVPNTSMNTNGNFGIRPMDTRAQPGMIACSGLDNYTSSFLGYGYNVNGQPAKKYVQRRIYRTILWLEETFPGQVSRNTVEATGSSMASAGSHNFTMSDYHLQTYTAGTDAGFGYLNNPLWTDVANEDYCTKGPLSGINMSFWDSIDLNWWIANDPWYSTGFCATHGFGRNDFANTPYSSTMSIINAWTNAKMCFKGYLGGGTHLTPEVNQHSTNDGCFRWGAILSNKMGFSLDHPALAFSDSTGDVPQGPWVEATIRAHRNLGLEWDSANIVETADTLTMPVMYQAKTFDTRDPLLYGETETTCEFSGGEQQVMPPMPANITATVTLQRPTNLPSRHANFVSKFWPNSGQSVTLTYGAHTDTQTAATDGRVTFENVPFTNGTYVDMVFTK